ncbi:Acg family FMN-binding oxidoreductase [Sutcliffiella rhizosphaerae]|uniref:NAD(P)H nitroreductase n=1 Tax=Sutcliffiella rhizosphaerae TaxID=2880967 RepID=A0ABM8YU31_9BACI|nr:hypothetical protein [Sutcliffiella rhizosphaerae]CAG9623484.1 Putative NAD(P)H nitroreductase [Sutcliffiella rhizosphaerae]
MEKEKDKMSRRTFLKKSGATFFIVTWAGITWRAVDQGVFSTGKGPAFEPWDTSKENVKTGTLALVNNAILASNPHNTQPWLFKVTDNYIELYADESRNLGTIDPFRREMFIGLGCAIENIMLSAEAHGYESSLFYKPNSLDPYCIARINLESGEKYESPLYNAIPYRHTHRGAYDLDQPIENKVLNEMENIILDELKVKLSWFTTRDEKNKIGNLIVQATEAIISDKEMSADSNKWFKENWKDIQEERDGITLDAQGGSNLIRAFGKILPPLSHEKNDQFWLSATQSTHTATAMAYGFISVKNSSDNEQRARAGRAWQRIHLYGTSLGIGMHPLNQLNEMADREKALQAPDHFSAELKKITDPSWNGLFIFRLGYPLKETNKSPRRAISEVVL